MIIPQNQGKTNSCRQNQYFRERPYVHTSWPEIYLFTCKKKSPYEQPSNQNFSTKSKKEDTT